MAENFAGILETFMPGMGDAYREATVANVWGDVLEMDQFKDLGLPKHGTPAFDAAAQKVYAQNPWLNNFDPPGPDGKPLPVREALRVKAETVAKLLAGERLSPKEVLRQIHEARQAERQNVERSNRRVKAGRSLGAGKSTAAFDSKSERNSLLDAFTRGDGMGGVL